MYVHVDVETYNNSRMNVYTVSVYWQISYDVMMK